MIQEDECIQTLMELGLTFLQAKTYLTLAKLGEADVKTIAKDSNVARQDIYRIMPKLQKFGLVDKIIANPTIYRAINLKKGLSILLQRKKIEHTELQNKTTSLLNNFRINETRKIKNPDNELIITSEKKLIMERLGKAIDAAQKSECVLCTEDEARRGGLFHHIHRIKNAVKRGVKIRLLTDKAEGELIPSKHAKELTETSFFERRYLGAPVPVAMIIFDEKEANIRLSSNIEPSLWSNNSEVVKIALGYFNELWSKAYKTANLNQKQKSESQMKLQNRNNRTQQIINTQRS